MPKSVTTILKIKNKIFPKGWGNASTNAGSFYNLVIAYD